MSSKFFRLLPVMALAPFSAFAEPTLYPKDLNTLSQVKNITDSNILADYLDSKTVWVLPPNKGEAEVAHMHSKTANMGFCREMRDIQGYSRELSAEIDAITKRKVEQEDRLLKLRDEASKANVEAEAFAAANDLSGLMAMDDQIEAINLNLTELNTQLAQCTQNCEVIVENIKITNKAKKEMLARRLEYSKQNAEAVRTYDKKKAFAKAKEKHFSDARNVYRELTQDLQDVRNDFHEAYKGFAGMEGARASLKYLSHWDSNVQKLRDLNPGINFAKVQANDAQVAMELSSLGKSNPSGAIMQVGAGSQLSESSLKFSSYPENLSTNVVLSLVGACPMEHPEYFDLNSNDMRYGMIITYSYDTVFDVNAEAKYNMYKMYQKIVSSGSSGGFFRSKSWSKVEEKNFFRDSFKVTWMDAENALPEETKQEIEAQMRANVFSRLAALALPVSPDRAGIVAAAAPPARGGAVLADQLVKTCPANIYCMGGAAILKVFDAIFGSSSSTSSYTNINDVEIIDDYRNSKKVTSAGVTSYLQQ